MYKWYVTGQMRSGNRAAGIGTPHDRYDDESGNPDFVHRRRVRVDYPREAEDLHKLNGPVIIIQAARKPQGET